MGTLITVAQVLLSLSILVTLHECGHFFPAKWFKTKVEKFYLFFNPYFELFKIQRGETEYGIGWLPMGGYVKIAGMIDESFDKEQMAGPPQPWEFRSKPAWQRLIIMIGGVTVNFVLGFFLFIVIAWVWGTSFVPTENVPNGIAVDSMGYSMGLRDGDIIKKLGTNDFDKFNPNLVKKEIIVNGLNNISVLRNGQMVEVPIDIDYAIKLTDRNNPSKLFGPRLAPVIDFIDQDSIASTMGLKKGDEIISINNKAVDSWNTFDEILDKSKEADVAIQVIRNHTDHVDTISLTHFVGKNNALNIRPVYPKNETESYSLGEAIPKGLSNGWNALADQGKAFSRMFKGEIRAKDSLGSIITIGREFGTEWDWKRFWGLTAMLSLILAVINLLPIPALDGGHVIFLLFEMITGIKPSDKVIEYSTLVGFILLVTLMVFALGLDISRLF